LVLPVESGTIPSSHMGDVVTSIFDVRKTLYPLFPKPLSESRFSSVRGDGGSSISVKLMLGRVFSTWA
jgi:hypothetical protein